MGLLKSAADVVYTIRFLKLLVTPIEDTEAYKLGIIDEKGKRRKDFDDNTLENREALRDHYTAFHRLVYNIKKLMAKAPGGSSRLASYAAALYLIKEHGNLDDKGLEKIHKETGIDSLDMLAEETKWYMLRNDELSPGVYRMKNPTMTANYADVVESGDQVRIVDGNPINEVFGIKIYQATHLKSQQSLYITTGEITK
jgi:hypothetical protein